MFFFPEDKPFFIKLLLNRKKKTFPMTHFCKLLHRFWHGSKVLLLFCVILTRNIFSLRWRTHLKASTMFGLRETGETSGGRAYPYGPDVLSKDSRVNIFATGKISGDFAFPPEDLEVGLDFHGRNGFFCRRLARNSAEKGSRQSETCIDIIILRHVLGESAKMFSIHSLHDSSG